MLSGNTRCCWRRPQWRPRESSDHLHSAANGAGPRSPCPPRASAAGRPERAVSSGGPVGPDRGQHRRSEWPPPTRASAAALARRCGEHRPKDAEAPSTATEVASAWEPSSAPVRGGSRVRGLHRRSSRSHRRLDRGPGHKAPAAHPACRVRRGVAAHGGARRGCCSSESRPASRAWRHPARSALRFLRFAIVDDPVNAAMLLIAELGFVGRALAGAEARSGSGCAGR